MTEMFGEAWSPMSVPDLAPDDDDIVPELKIDYEIYIVETIQLDGANSLEITL